MTEEQQQSKRRVSLKTETYVKSVHHYQTRIQFISLQVKELLKMNEISRKVNLQEILGFVEIWKLFIQHRLLFPS